MVKTREVAAAWESDTPCVCREKYCAASCNLVTSQVVVNYLRWAIAYRDAGTAFPLR